MPPPSRHRSTRRSERRATLERDGDQGVLRVSGLPQHRNRIYEVWIARGKEVRPRRLFQVDARGGSAAIPTGSTTRTR